MSAVEAIGALLTRGAAEPDDALARAFIRVDPRDAGAVRRALAAAERLPATPARERLAGRALIELGRAAEAAERLEGAGDEALFAEAALLAGRPDAALAAARTSTAEPAAVLRALALLALGDAPGAVRAAQGAVGAAAEAAAALASREEGAQEAGLRRCAELRRDKAWPWALLAASRTAKDDLGGARLALAEALLREPLRAWLHAEAARVEEKAGVIPVALKHAERAIALDPTLEHRLLRAELLDRWREHVEAAAEYGRAAALSPRDAGIAWSRAKALSAANRLPDALKAGDHAAALAPHSLDIGEWPVRIALASGRADARRRLAALKKRFAGAPGAPAHFAALDGYAALCARRWAAAAAAYERAARLAPGTPHGRRARFYAAAARVLAVSGPMRLDGLVLDGLGIDPPYTATAGDLRALAGATTLFNNVMGDEMFEFLRALCRDVRPGAYHQDNDEERICAEVTGAIPRKGSAFWVTRGNAIIYGPLGSLMLERRRGAGKSWRCLPGVASLEGLHARHGHGGVPAGLAVVDVRALAAGARVDPRLTTAVFWELKIGEAAQRKACRALAESLGPDRVCLVFDHIIAQEPVRRKAGELEGMLDRLSPSAIILIAPGAA